MSVNRYIALEERVTELEAGLTKAFKRIEDLEQAAVEETE